MFPRLWSNFRGYLWKQFHLPFNVQKTLAPYGSLTLEIIFSSNPSPGRSEHVTHFGSPRIHL